MAAATTPKAAAAESPVDPAVAEAEAAAKEAKPVIEREFEVLRDFASYVKTQLLHFKKGDVVASHPGESLHAAGAPLKPLA